MNNNVICWFEIYVDNIERAKKFYSDVIGNQFQDSPVVEGSEDFKMSFFSNPENQGVNGALVQTKETRAGKGTSTLIYFPCEDCSIEESKVEKAGGKVLTPKMSLGEFGFCSICLDTEGNSFGLYSM